MSSGLIDWTPQEVRILEPIERLSMKEWVEKYHMVTGKSDRPEKWDIELTPFLPQLMDLITQPNIEMFVFKKSAQIAGSEICYAFLMWANDQQPGESLVVLADQDTSEWVCKNRFEKAYKANPKLSKLYMSSTLNSVRAVGQTIDFAWSTSINKLASKPKKYLILDEISKWKLNKLETKPTYNAIQRTETFIDKKILALSTPNVVNSEIDVLYKLAHKRYQLYVPCPDCGHFQVLRWTRQPYEDMQGETRQSGYVHWEGGKDATPQQIQRACYCCGECGTLWTSLQKNEAVSKAVWHSNDQYDGIETKIAAHINRLYSLFPGGRFQSLVEEFIQRKKDGTLDAWKDFVNNVLAEEFEDVVQSASKVNVFQYVVNREENVIPSDTIAIVCGVDNQKDFKYFTVLALNKEFKASIVEFGKLDNWLDLEELMNKRYQLEGNKKEVKIWKCAIDSGGTTIDGKSMTHDVYKFVRHQDDRYCAIKGKDFADNSIIVQKKRLEDNMPLYRVNTQALLDQFYWMLGNGDITFYNDIDKEYLKHINNFKKIKNSSGRDEWVATSKRVDYVHTICYAIAAAHPQFEGGITELKRLPFQYNKEKPASRQREQPQGRFGSRRINPNF